MQSSLTQDERCLRIVIQRKSGDHELELKQKFSGDCPFAGTGQIEGLDQACPTWAHQKLNWRMRIEECTSAEEGVCLPEPDWAVWLASWQAGKAGLDSMSRIHRPPLAVPFHHMYHITVKPKPWSHPCPFIFSGLILIPDKCYSSRDAAEAQPWHFSLSFLSCLDSGQPTAVTLKAYVPLIRFPPNKMCVPRQDATSWPNEDFSPECKVGLIF